MYKIFIPNKWVMARKDNDVNGHKFSDYLKVMTQKKSKYNAIFITSLKIELKDEDKMDQYTDVYPYFN